uniref:Integrator complex subunit 5 C-terminal domain-containing protein n=1 Tax=Timema genevievae TaxID=629358 RepID=A0A7R9JX18_TIMGE|nr:unnamed protein product [Timema genevievae]
MICMFTGQSQQPSWPSGGPLAIIGNKVHIELNYSIPPRNCYSCYLSANFSPHLCLRSGMVGKLSPHEVVQLLRDCVWNYLRDHVPSPALFGRDDLGVVWRDPSQAWPGPQYIETFRLILQTNIEQLGALYSQLFFAPT